VKRFLIFGMALALIAILAIGASGMERKGLFGVGVAGGVGIPTGALNKGAAGVAGTKLGWRAGGGVGYFVKENLAVIGMGTFAQNKADSVPSGYTDDKTQLLEFGASVEHFFKMQNEKVSPFVTLGLGGLSSKAKLTPTPTAGNKSYLFLGGKIGGGAMFGLTPAASIFVEAAFHNYARGKKTENSVELKFKPVNYIAAQVGFAYMFGKSSSSGGTTQ